MRGSAGAVLPDEAPLSSHLPCGNGNGSLWSAASGASGTGLVPSPSVGAPVGASGLARLSTFLALPSALPLSRLDPSLSLSYSCPWPYSILPKQSRFLT